MNRATTAIVAALTMIGLSGPALAGEVTTGKVIRGLALPVPVPAPVPGTPTGTTCDFSKEPVSQAGRLEGASVNCKEGETNTQNVLMGMDAFLTAYCVINAPVKSARLITAPKPPTNPNHCDLSGITPNDAKGQFGGAVWR
ncbi:MAG TPA: hypothetical protein VEL76_12385 [Gemmataceae bacterium]|nr:hypothetical protein [Gemmataceae bacterium]